MSRHSLLISISLFCICLNISFTNEAPVVSNVSASQRGNGSKLVDISYDLADLNGDNCTIWVAVSNNSGSNWRIPARSFSGDIGSEISPGISKHVVWDAGNDIPGMVDTFMIRVYADDGEMSDSLVIIPAGTLYMGDSFGGGDTDDEPVHTVYLDSFMISTHEITNHKYCEFLNSEFGNNNIKVVNGSVFALTDTTNSYVYCVLKDSSASSRIIFSGTAFTAETYKEYHPMIHVSWYGAAAYCNWRSELEDFESMYTPSGNWSCSFNGPGFRLPTEAEWEYASRGGLHHQKYSWGNSMANNQFNFSGSGDPFEVDLSPHTTPIGFYDGSIQDKASHNWPGSQTSYQTDDSVNGYGLYDAAGNVYEWCNDWYQSDYYSNSPGENPHGPASGTYRIFRGGCWDYLTNYSAVYDRSSYFPYLRTDIMGFRIVLDFD